MGHRWVLRDSNRAAPGSRVRRAEIMIPSKAHLQKPDGMTFCGLNSLSVLIVPLKDMERTKTCKTCLVRLDAIAKEELTRKNH